MMGDRYILTVTCPKCGTVNNDVYYAPTCGFLTYKCNCDNVIDLGKYSGISCEDASNRAEIEILIRTLTEKKKR